MVIGDKRPREDSTSLPSKKGKAADNSKGKEATLVPEAKKKVVKPNNVVGSRVTPALNPGKGPLANLGTVLGPKTFIMSSPSVAEKIVRGMILPVDKEKVEQLTLDQTTIRLFHVIDQVLTRLRY